MADIISLAGIFKSQIDLKKYCDAQYLTLKSANETIKKQEDEIVHLKNLLKCTTPIAPELQVCSEQEVIEIELNRLKKRSMATELSLEDTKRLEILVKLLKIIKERPNTKDPLAEFKKAQDSDLMAVAKTGGAISNADDQ